MRFAEADDVALLQHNPLLLLKLRAVNISAEGRGVLDENSLQDLPVLYALLLASP